MKNVIKKMGNSGFFYLPFKVFEGALGVFALSLYTRIFGEKVFGSYSVINASTMLIAILCIAWLRFVTVRYIRDYSSGESRAVFMSTVLFGYVVSLAVGALLLFLNISLVTGGINLKDILFYALFYVGYTFSQLFVDLLLYDDKRKTNLCIVVAAAVIKPALVYTLYAMNFNPYLAIIAGHGIVDILFGAYAIRRLGIFDLASPSKIDKKLLKEFLSYGFPLIGLTLTIYILNVADRYVIDYYYGEGAVGVYSANYTIASSVFTLLTLGLSKGFYPQLLSFWSKGDVDGSERVLGNALRNYLLLGVPSAIGLSFVAKDLSHLLFGEAYWGGYAVMSLSAIGMFFFGLSEYFNKAYELKKDTFQITKNSLFASGLNIILNLIFVPVFGMIAAAFTTLFCFAIYAVICLFRRERSISIRLSSGFLRNLIIMNSFLLISLFVLDSLLVPGVFRLISLVFAGIIVYGALGVLLLRKEFF